MFCIVSQSYLKRGGVRPILGINSVRPKDEEYVNQKLKERSEAKLQKDLLLADDIRDELRFRM
jgi:cysteinyl-tRNA synthetase